MTMKKLSFILLILVLCSALGCGDDKNLVLCQQHRAALEAKNKELIATVKNLQSKVDDMREILRKKHEEVSLHRNMPEVADQRMVKIEMEHKQLVEQMEDLQLKHETLLRRYDNQQRQLMRCQRKLTSQE